MQTGGARVSFCTKGNASQRAWPCVRESIGSSACSAASAAMESMRASCAGRMWRASASRSISACARLLMSSLVQPKCTNSDTAASSGKAVRRLPYGVRCRIHLPANGPPAPPSTHFLMAYSTALTSWLVVASNSLTSSAATGPKSASSCSRNATAAGLSGGTSGTPGSAASVCVVDRVNHRRVTLHFFATPAASGPPPARGT
jgi:hypothetical protein